MQPRARAINEGQVQGEQNAIKRRVLQLRNAIIPSKSMLCSEVRKTNICRSGSFYSDLIQPNVCLISKTAFKNMHLISDGLMFGTIQRSNLILI